jgi:hypothetical protein
LAWTRITDQDEAATLLPAWLGRRLVGLHGSFGLLLGTGDVMRVTSIGAVHMSSEGVVLLDVALDHAGIPDGADLAWQSKHYLGAPMPGATMGTVNLAHVVAAVEFVEVATADRPSESASLTRDEVVAELGQVSAESNADAVSREMG